MTTYNRRNPQECNEALSTYIGLLCLLCILSLMGWCAIDKYSDTPTMPYLDSDSIKIYNTRALKYSTYLFNERMEERAK